ncbi:MAG: lysophospholipid acyltransferase family protein [Anaerolineae bacterium]|nr:lysophospholipid acyltransferase family protein [Anaerolineae bacterium]MDQ7035268.1 lysophospholipid acyltransferase family protein [Anaerolineae bacterium]
MSDAVADFVARQPQINKRRRILRPMLRAVGSLVCKVEVTGLEHVPDCQTPTILMMNHISTIDPIVFTAIIENRYVISMAKAETLENWFLRRIVQLWGNFVIRRGEVDREALNNAIDLLKNQQLVLIAPEGTRNPEGLEAAYSGIAYIAHKSNAIILPAAISGAQDWSKRLTRFKRAYARVNIGRPFRFRLPEGKRLTRPIREQMTQEAMYQLATAFPDEYATLRGVYSDLSQATTDYLEFV